MNADLRTHKDLDAWKKAIELVEAVYGLTRGFPKTEMYGLTNQLRRAAVEDVPLVVEPDVHMASVDHVFNPITTLPALSTLVHMNRRT